MKSLIKFFLVIVLLASAYWVIIKNGRPSNERDWSDDQVVLPYAEIAGDEVKIYNIRNFFYRSVSDYDPNYYNATFNLNRLQTVDFVMEPFSDNPEAAHTFLSFGFSDGRHVAISPEIRKEKGESFSAAKGLFNQYELMYVIADERDVINLRANHRKDKVYVYPGKTTPENLKKLFLDMLDRANKLKEKPEYYHTFVNSCTTNLVRHINNVNPGRVDFDFRILTPGKSDALALELGLIDTDLTLEEARKKFQINDKAGLYKDSLSFSQRIRDGR